MTKQRRQVLDVLKEAYRHLTAEEIYDILKQKGETLVFATVYNSLNYLFDNGYIRKIHTDAGGDCYDGNLIPHDHFICEKCGNVVDVPSSKRIKKAVCGNHRIHSCETTYRGVCECCLVNS